MAKTREITSEGARRAYRLSRRLSRIGCSLLAFPKCRLRGFWDGSRGGAGWLEDGRLAETIGSRVHRFSLMLSAIGAGENRLLVGNSSERFASAIRCTDKSCFSFRAAAGYC